MHHQTTRVLAAFAIVGAAAVGLSACSSTNGNEPAATPSSTSESSSMLPPVIVEIADAEGTTVEVPLDNVVDLVTGDNESVSAWTAKISDESVIEFVPGKDDGSAQFNPGLTPLAEGTSDVVLSNSETDSTVSFTVTVTAAAM
ncbi:hypothetical protein N1027_01135 [Herbiconiux sp. CPCC 205763]|uniref:MSP domain-containing protein n=1 Tax=Herbiconiux aconitum TaxID=2970913 RepID=A0ABT2GP77_9MICO|nr:hypothetical protein [Herbiconiux aconitum]MCS5716734.1 hypothetical protein [Herbiconiux aconitum]